eukprot:scaffold2846_cov231-Alexandrium_tamarense.AAC.2
MLFGRGGAQLDEEAFVEEVTLLYQHEANQGSDNRALTHITPSTAYQMDPVTVENKEETMEDCEVLVEEVYPHFTLIMDKTIILSPVPD